MKKGFTLIEMVITITIIIILSSISVPLYKSYTSDAILAEGYLLLSTIRDAQKNYYAEYGNFLSRSQSSYPSGMTSYEEVLGIDARGNKYFTWFSISGGGVGNCGFYFGPEAVMPSEIYEADKRTLMLQYNITLGQRFCYYPGSYDESWTTA